MSLYGPRVSVLSRVMSRVTRTSAYSLPQCSDRRALTCAARTTSGELSGASALGTAWVQLHIVSHLVRVQDEVHLKPREPILGASSIKGKGCSALARSGVAELWFIFMHVCASVFQLCTLLNTCNAARSATASRIFVLPSEINSLSAEFLHAI